MSLAQEAKPAKELLKEAVEVEEEAVVAVEATVAEEDTEEVVVVMEVVATVVAKEDMEVAIATEEVVMEVVEEDMEEVAVDTEVEVAVVTIENHPMVSLWYCTQLPFYDIYYVSCFNTCENVTKLLHHFNSLTTKSKTKQLSLNNHITYSFSPLPRNKL